MGDVGNGLGVTKVNLHGEIIWSKNYYNGYATSANDIKHTNDGEYIIIGEFSGAGYKQLMLFKINFEGDSLWSKTYGDNDGNHYLASSVQETQDGGFIIAGEIYTDHNVLWIVRTDSIGDTLWTKSYDRSGYRSVYAQTIKSTKNSDEYIILSNSYKSKHLYLDYDIWMLKINSMGDTIWTKTFGGDKSDFG